MSRVKTYIVLILILMTAACTDEKEKDGERIVFLHHSTGEAIWNGTPSFTSRVIRKISPTFAYRFYKQAPLPFIIKKHNRKNAKNYVIKDLQFPMKTPYGWKNYPFDYYNIWVKNGQEDFYMEEPTLNKLTRDYDMIIFKHCYPVSNIMEATDSADINSEVKTLPNYQLQYMALKEKLHEYPDNKFLLFTAAAQVKAKITEEEAERTEEFVNWVINEWDEPDDNIFIWDLYNLQTAGDKYLKDEFAYSPTDSHPNPKFSGWAVKLLANRIIDVIENNGKSTSLTGELLVTR